MKVSRKECVVKDARVEEGIQKDTRNWVAVV